MVDRAKPLKCCNCDNRATVFWTCSPGGERSRLDFCDKHQDEYIETNLWVKCYTPEERDVAMIQRLL